MGWDALIEDLIKSRDMYMGLYHKKCQQLEDHENMLKEMYDENERLRGQNCELKSRIAELEVEMSHD